MAKRARTIADVAKVAGVSTATVSRALNGGTVSDQAREAVDDAVARLHYRRNDLARGLVTGRTGVIGVLIPDVIGPLYAQMARGIEDVLEPLGMHYMMVTDNRDLDQEAQAIELLLARQIDALVLIGSGLGAGRLRALLPDGTPTVMVQREIDAQDGLPTVEIDNAAGIHSAVDHLVRWGHTRIAHVGGLRRDAAERAVAFRDAVRHHGLEPGAFVESDSTEEGGIGAAEALLAGGEPVTAVVCSNDRLAAGAYHAFKRHGLRLPDDLSVVGFDDLPWSPYLDPPLTTVRQPAREMGRVAARQVVRGLEGQGGAERTRIPAELVCRASVADRRAAPKEVSAD